jgi:murein DD-endopeptidase MepM/ murein hydrolase activator NlpD
MQDVNLQINELQKQIDRRVQEIADNKQVLRQLIIELNELGDNSFVQLALGSGDFSKFLDQMQYTNSLQDKMYQIVQNIKLVKQKLESQQADLKAQLQKLKALSEQLKNTQDALQSQEQDRQNLLNKTRGIEKNYQKLLSSSLDQQADLQKEMDDLDAQVRAKLGNKTVTAKKGSLVKPMNGILTQGYGNTGFKALGYSFHNGLDIAAPAGEPIYAAADGVVNGCDTGDASYGNWCTVKHTLQTSNGSICVITLYGHMRQFKVRVGQSLQQGDLIGYEGNTGNTTRLLYGPDRGYHLHFTVFDCEGFGINPGKYSKTYGAYTVPYGYTYNPKDFLP